MMLAMGTFVYATRAIAGFGAVAVAGHEILRTLWVTATQAFSSLDIATQVGGAQAGGRKRLGLGLPQCPGCVTEGDVEETSCSAAGHEERQDTSAAPP